MDLYPRHGKIPRWYNKVEDTSGKISPKWKRNNRNIEGILRKHGVKTVLDLTCGTGSQVFWLAKRGYKVTGVDINPGPLRVARMIARREKADVRLLHGDMRTVRAGKFDAAISMWNAVGHLTRAGFEKAMRNINRNLNDGGLYVFDIENLNYAADWGFAKSMPYDRASNVGGTRVRQIQFSIVKGKGILFFYTARYEQRGSGKLKMSLGVGTHQIYTAKELREMLARSGFRVLSQYSMDMSKFSDRKTESILTIAKKR